MATLRLMDTLVKDGLTPASWPPELARTARNDQNESLFDLITGMKGGPNPSEWPI